MAWTDGISHQQLKFINALLTDRDLRASAKVAATGQEYEAAIATIRERATTLTRRQASEWIDALKQFPFKARNAEPVRTEDVARRPIPEVAQGRYALVENGTTKFYEVDRPKRGRYAGRTFLSELQGDNHAPIKLWEQRDRFFAILDAIAADPEVAVRRYGHHFGQCGYCRKDLTDAFSRFFGVGPKCARDHGLPFSFASYLKAHPDQAEAVVAWQAEDARVHADETEVTKPASTPVVNRTGNDQADRAYRLWAIRRDGIEVEQKQRADEMDTIRGEVSKMAEEHALAGDTRLRSAIIRVQRLAELGEPLYVIDDQLAAAYDGDTLTFARDYARATTFFRS